MARTEQNVPQAVPKNETTATQAAATKATNMKACDKTVNTTNISAVSSAVKASSTAPQTPSATSPSAMSAASSASAATTKPRAEEPPSYEESLETSGEDQMPPAKKLRIDFSVNVKMSIVGHTYYIPRNLIQARSKHIARIIEQDSSEILNDEHLGSPSLDVFETYLQLLFTNELVLPAMCTTEPKRLLKLLKTKILVEHLADAKSENLVIPALLQGCREVYATVPPPPRVVNYVYEETTSRSTCRRILIHLFAEHGITSRLGEYPPDFVQDLAAELMQRHSNHAKVIVNSDVSLEDAAKDFLAVEGDV